jgi:signal transduction histidine kinase
VNPTVYESVVSKMGTIMPLFGKALVDMALKRRGHTAETITPVEMLELIKTEINPRLADQLHTVSTVLNAGAGVAQTDGEDRVVYLNSMMRRLVGGGEEPLPSAALFDRLRTLGFTRSVHEVESLEIHESHSAKLGKDFSVTLYPIRDGEGSSDEKHGVVSIIQDITVREAIDAEIMRFHESLRQLNQSLMREVAERERAESELRNVVQCIADPILVVGQDGRIERANPAAEQLCELCEPDILHRPVDELIQPSVPLQRGLLAELEAKTTLHDLDAMLTLPRHKPIPILLSGAVLRDGPEGATGAVLSARDMRQQHALLAKLLSTSKLAALGEMAGGIAHEINTPLTVIQGRAGQIRRMVNEEPRDTLDTRTLATFAEKIEATTQRIARIVRGLRAFARQGDHEPLQPVVVNALVQDALDLCRERFKTHGVALRTGPIDETLRVPARGTQIGQVLVNLLSNAFDAVEQAEERWVLLTVEPHGERVEIAVEDSGPGIPPALRERMFQPFFTTKPVGKGTGLGLSISHGIAQEHGGSLFLDETCPHTRFVVSLPLAPPAEAKKSA